MLAHQLANQSSISVVNNTSAGWGFFHTIRPPVRQAVSQHLSARFTIIIIPNTTRHQLPHYHHQVIIINKNNYQFPLRSSHHTQYHCHQSGVQGWSFHRQVRANQLGQQGQSLNAHQGFRGPKAAAEAAQSFTRPTAAYSPPAISSAQIPITEAARSPPHQSTMAHLSIVSGSSQRVNRRSAINNVTAHRFVTHHQSTNWHYLSSQLSSVVVVITNYRSGHHHQRSPISSNNTSGSIIAQSSSVRSSSISTVGHQSIAPATITIPGQRQSITVSWVISRGLSSTIRPLTSKGTPSSIVRQYKYYRQIQFNKGRHQSSRHTGSAVDRHHHHWGLTMAHHSSLTTSQLTKVTRHHLHSAHRHQQFPMGPANCIPSSVTVIN